MSPAERLTRFALAVESLEDLETRLSAAIEAGKIDAAAVGEPISEMLLQLAENVLALAPSWPELLAGAEALSIPEPFGGREGFGRYIASARLYFAEEPEVPS